MARDHSRPSTPAPVAKRIKVAHVSAEEYLFPGLLADSNAEKLRSTYASNTPYKYAIVEKLFQEDLLTHVKNECVNELSFTEKETDIYKVCMQIQN
jgi:hypothetical protein